MKVSRLVPAATLWLPLLAILTVIFWRVFPIYDDAYLLLLIRDTGVGQIAVVHSDRPLLGALFELAARVGGMSPTVYVFISALLWIGLAAEVGMLWRQLFPSHSDAGAVAGALCLALLRVDVRDGQPGEIVPYCGLSGRHP
jgi:hypothetical protein